MAAIIAGTTTSFESFTVWANGTGWGLAFACLVALAFVFPSGVAAHQPDAAGRGRLAGHVDRLRGADRRRTGRQHHAVGAAPSASTFPNPYAILPGSAAWSVIPDAGSLFTFLFVLVATSLLALFVRFRRSSGLERLQYRWLVWAIAVVTLGTVVWATATFVLRVDAGAAVPHPARHRLSVRADRGGHRGAPLPPVRDRPARQPDARLGRWRRPRRWPCSSSPCSRSRRPSQGSSRARRSLWRPPRCSPSPCSSRCGRASSVRRPALRPPAARGGAEPRRAMASGSNARSTSARSPETWRRPPSRRSARRPSPCGSGRRGGRS